MTPSRVASEMIILKAASGKISLGGVKAMTVSKVIWVTMFLKEVSAMIRWMEAKVLTP